MGGRYDQLNERRASLSVLLERTKQTGSKEGRSEGGREKRKTATAVTHPHSRGVQLSIRQPR